VLVLQSVIIRWSNLINFFRVKYGFDILDHRLYRMFSSKYLSKSERLSLMNKKTICKYLTLNQSTFMGLHPKREIRLNLEDASFALSSRETKYKKGQFQILRVMVWLITKQCPYKMAQKSTGNSY